MAKRTIDKVAVIGAGVMGAQIAAHCANAGHEVVLLDIVPKGTDDRSAVAKGAIAKLLKADPQPFMHKRFAKRITPGNLEDDLDLVADCDWIVEAIIEKVAIKQDLYKRLDGVRKQGSIVSSNTSTIALNKLVDGMPESFRRDFLITHFFNPPRYMRLLELVAGTDTDPEALETIRDFGDKALGKTCVDCNDTPGFIANRIGTLWITAATTDAMDMGLTVEEADAAMGRPVGIPKTGVFGLIDLVGLDLMPLVAGSLSTALPKDDLFNRVFRDEPLFNKMIADGYTGRKGKGGFYRLNREGGGKVKESIDLKTGEYAKSVKPRIDSVSAAKSLGLRGFLTHGDKPSQYVWSVMRKTLGYAASLVPEICGTIDAVDDAMKLGYAWKKGPFELIDEMGPAWFAAELEKDGMPVPELLKKVGDGSFYKVDAGNLQRFTVDGGYETIERPEGVLLLADVKRRSDPVLKNGSAKLWDIGDGIFCFEFASKMNAIDPELLGLLGKSVGHVARKGKGLVIHNEGSNFSVGANLGLALFALNIAAWPEIENMVEVGQETYKALKYAPVPVVGAPFGMALGGGCEVLLHSDRIVAHAESYVGLVEVGVGLIPGWGGCKEMLVRLAQNPRMPKGPMPPVAKAFETIGTAQVAKSAEQAKELGFFRHDDRIVMNRDRVLYEAKQEALRLAEAGYQPPEPAELRLPGPSGRAALDMALDGFKQRGMLTPHDAVVSAALAEVLTGGPEADHTVPMTEDDVIKLEREHFAGLIRTAGTVARVEHMLETGKPLRN
ncbi:MAG: 3-hydroxyacyl-CoA dehydrogenase NAD-binding domain-containing protein [Alphaproteobacteria bacterium]|nr:3-hydroxyacyl-CoA dehydrogenase NAD-binding domain-containing protein [Alphaproteobacteria bacterium]